MPPLQLPPPLLAAPPPPPAASATPTPAPEGAVPVAPQGEDKPVCAAPVPEGPPEPTDALLPATAGVAVDENYSKDEQALNSFLRLHPMLSAEACSQRTLQAMAGMFEKAVVGAGQLPVVGKLHDDAMLRPPNDAIGERPCVNADRCLAQFIAQLRYGPGTPYAFTCTEYLLPDQRRDFLNGKGAAPARLCGKCTALHARSPPARQALHLLHLARTDPNFKVGETSLGLQVFCNAVGPSDDAGGAAVHDDAAAPRRRDRAADPRLRRQRQGRVQAVGDALRRRGVLQHAHRAREPPRPAALQARRPLLLDALPLRDGGRRAAHPAGGHRRRRPVQRAGFSGAGVGPFPGVGKLGGPSSP